MEEENDSPSSVRERERERGSERRKLSSEVNSEGVICSWDLTGSEVLLYSREDSSSTAVQY